MMDGAMGETGYWIKRGTGVRMKENLSVRLIKRERKRIEKRGRGEKGDRRTHLSETTVCSRANPRRPSGPLNRPNPLYLQPPKGNPWTR